MRRSASPRCGDSRSDSGRSGSCADVVRSPTNHNPNIATASDGQRDPPAPAPPRRRACSLRQPRSSGMPTTRRAAIWSASARRSDAASWALSQRSESISSRRASRYSTGSPRCRARPGAHGRDRATQRQGRHAGATRRRVLRVRASRAVVSTAFAAARRARSACRAVARAAVRAPRSRDPPAGSSAGPCSRAGRAPGTASRTPSAASGRHDGPAASPARSRETLRPRRPGAPPRRRKSPLPGDQGIRLPSHGQIISRYMLFASRGYFWPVFATTGRS